MADIKIWDGAATFTAGMTPFGFYDSDTEFQRDAVKVAQYCSRKLGYPMMDVELTSGSFFAAFEEAITSYGNEVYQSLAANQFGNLAGMSGGSAINTTLIKVSLENMIRTSNQYGMEAGVGGFTTMHTGSLSLSQSVQEYDLTQWAVDQGITGSIEVRKVFYEAPPAIMRYFDPYAGTGTGVQSLMDAFDFGSYSPGVNFLLMPASYDILKTQAIEFNDQIRKSAYSFEIINNKLQVFPIPKKAGKLRFEFYKRQEKTYIDDGLQIDAGASGGTLTGGGGEQMTTNNQITNLANVPTKNPVYKEINSIGRQWIFKYTATLCKEILAYVRGKYQTVPVPGSEATLNQADLLADVRSEKEAYVTELRELLNKASLSSQLELQATQTKYIGDALQGVPMGIFIG
tara:strand:- start:3989 stop:5191 length:1203 start_codon:yes stop_codon:yes gene_type:complete